jgi:hypothetical protein
MTVFAVVGCAPETPDYQAVWSTTSATTSASPTASPSEATVPISAYLEQKGVLGEPVAPDKVTDLTVSIPTPAGWQPYQNPNMAPGTRMIAKGATYPTAMLMVFTLEGDFDAAEAIKHANVDARMSEGFQELNSSSVDFGGFPSSMIEGSYDLSNARMHTYNRIVIATGAAPARQRYLVQFTVTGYADKAAAEAPDIETIIKGFTVKVPTS